MSRVSAIISELSEAKSKLTSLSERIGSKEVYVDHNGELNIVEDNDSVVFSFEESDRLRNVLNKWYSVAENKGKICSD